MVNKETLARAGENTFGGVIKGGFSAHPHRHADGKTVFNVGMDGTETQSSCLCHAPIQAMSTAADHLKSTFCNAA